MGEVIGNYSWVRPVYVGCSDYLGGSDSRLYDGNTSTELEDSADEVISFDIDLPSSHTYWSIAGIRVYTSEYEMAFKEIRYKDPTLRQLYLNYSFSSSTGWKTKTFSARKTTRNSLVLYMEGEESWGSAYYWLSEIQVYAAPIITDNNPPTVSFDISSQTWTTSNIEVTVTVTDNESSVSSSEYCWSSSTAIPSTGWTSFNSGDTLIQSIDGEWYLHVRATDAGNNTTNTYAGSYQIDKSPPTVSLDLTSRPWDTSQVQVNISKSDEVSGVASVEYLWSTSAEFPSSGFTTQVTNPVTKSENGEWYLHVKVTDNAGNISTTTGGLYQIDGLTPEASFSQVNQEWDDSSVSITVSLSDAGGSGLDIMEYAVTESTTTPSSWNTLVSANEVITISEVGEWYLHVHGVDLAGNELVTYRGAYRIRYLSVYSDNLGVLKVPNDIKIWDGVEFRPVEIYRWDGSQWSLLSK